MKFKPLVSVIMSVYNEVPEYLIQSVDSILKQTYKNIEFLIVDDGCKAAIKKKLSNIVTADSRIRLFEQRNKGLTKTLNWMIRHSNGTYIARQDSDDISAPDRIEKQVTYLLAKPNFKLLGTGCFIIDTKGKVLRQERVLTKSSVLKRKLKRTNQFVHGSVMFKADIFKNEKNMYCEICNYAQDYDLFLRISEQYKIANISKPLYKYRISNDSISHSKMHEQLFMGMIVREAAKMRRKNRNVTWTRELYEQIEATLETRIHRRKLKYLILTARARNALLISRKKEAQRLFIQAFITSPDLKSMYRIITTLV